MSFRQSGFDDFWIGQTEVTYELWNTVYKWATDDSLGPPRYSFANPGREGHDGLDGADFTEEAGKEPVTMVNWRDAIVFCNAFTEFYNASTGADLTCVYTMDREYLIPLTDSRNNDYGSSIDSIPGSFDNPYINLTGTGFRLPSVDEWKVAARGWDGLDYFSTIWCASGSSVENTEELFTEVIKEFCVYDSNSISSVRSKSPNLLNCYDMNGNVNEWCFDSKDDIYRSLRGGSFRSGSRYMYIGYGYNNYPYTENNKFGFRLCRSEY